MRQTLTLEQVNLLFAFCELVAVDKQVDATKLYDAAKASINNILTLEGGL